MYQITTSNSFRTYGPDMNRPLRDRKARHLQYETGYCPHGVYVGGCGADYMCGACEDGYTRRYALDAAPRARATYRIVIPGLATTQLGIFHDARAVHALARIAAAHNHPATITRTIRQDGRIWTRTYHYTPSA